MKKATQIESAPVFWYFEKICAIPHGSGDMDALSEYCMRFAEENGLQAVCDEAKNVVIYKPGTKGYENAEPVILQGHLDMVCQKTENSTMDFAKDGIEAFTDGDFIKAKGTTLGADNGVAVALMLTILDDDSLVHPALECVFTTDEETGLVGAETLDKSQIDARIMINLDSEEEGVATVSCAGGVVATYTRPVTREHKAGSALTLEISGLLGGHSGADIHLERGNGNLLMARMVERLMAAGDLALVTFNGGTKDNAINRECKAVLVYPDHAAAEAGAAIAASIVENIKVELEVFDPGFACAIAVEDGVEVDAMSKDDALALVRALRLAPNGVMRRNVAADGSVEVSSNIGVVAVTDDQIKILLSPRSSIKSLQDDVKDRIATLAEVLGFDVIFEYEYPGWSYVEHSPVREVFQESYRELFGTELRIESIHAGLECGLFADALPGLDAIAVGPQLYDVHTPDEHMELASFERFYVLLVDALRRLAQ